MKFGTGKRKEEMKVKNFPKRKKIGGRRYNNQIQNKFAQVLCLFTTKTIPSKKMVHKNVLEYSESTSVAQIR